MHEYSILFIHSEERSAKKIADSLQPGFEGRVEWTFVEALFDGLRIMQERTFDLILSDLFLPDGQGLATVRHLKQHAPQVPVIVLCHGADRDTAVNAVRKGAHDFICYEELEDAGKLRRAIAGALKTGAEKGATRPNGADRRTNARFPCKLAVSYQALERPFLSGVATGETLNISSKGLLFATDEALEPGQLLQVSVDWPARLENQVPLKLVAEGRIVRNLNGQAAMRIDKYEFRTRRTTKSAVESFRNQSSNRPSEAARGASPLPGTAADIKTGGKARRDV
jgi:CheY-like chemotaxis protein